MPNEASIPTKNKSSSVANADAHETWWEKLFSTRTDALLLWSGLFFLLCNFAVFFGVDTRPNAWLCYLNISYWTVSVPVSILLWTITIWIILELTDIVENFLRFFRMSMVIGILLTLVFLLQSYITPSTMGYPWWSNVLIVATVWSAVRSLFLLYDYRYEGDGAIDMEEAQWFWGTSGLLFAVLIIFGVMSIIPVSVQLYAGEERLGSASLFQFCWHGLQDVLRTGKGTLGIKLFGILLFTITIALLYVAGQWALIFLSRLREK